MCADCASIREGLLDTVDGLGKHGQKGCLERLGELKGKILNQEFSMVVMGQFKRGESTFNNAVLGAQIVPYWKKSISIWRSVRIRPLKSSYVLHRIFSRWN